MRCFTHSTLTPGAFVAIIFKVTQAVYWFRDYQENEGSAFRKSFAANTSCLYGLEIPSALENLEVCNETCKKRERNSLVAFYSKTRGGEWYKNGLWNSSHILHCDWRGVLCDSKTGHVISINLPDTNLRGRLTPELNNIHYLLGICLSRNRIYEHMEAIGDILPKYFLRICLPYNDVRGSIPRNLSVSFPLLAKLQLTGNEELSGSLPEDICNLKGLQVLSIGETKISGSVPLSIGKLGRLWFLDFEALKMSGDISLFRNLSKIKLLHLSSNKLTGRLPSDIGYLYPNIEELYVQNNALHGDLPESIGLLKNLKVLNIAKNQLDGNVPATLGRLNLKVLIISGNRFDGFADNFLGNSTALSIFFASDNKGLNCTIQRLMDMLSPAVQTLRQLDVSFANLTGNLPADIFHFKKLTFLKLASNKLAGPLPIPLDNMPYMTQLDLSFNSLTGAIPPSFSPLLMLLKLDLRGNTNMRGEVVSSFLKLDSVLRVKDSSSAICPLVRFAHNNGVVYVDSSYFERKYCFCKEHFYGFGGFCYPCMLNGVCPGINSSCSPRPSNRHVYFAQIFVKKGFWPFPHADNATRLLQCPTSLFHNNICVPGKSCECNLKRSNNISFFSKPNVECNQSCLCAKGHMGRFCSQCKTNYYQEGIRCIKCSKGSNEQMQVAVLIIAVFAVVFATIVVVRISKTRPKQAVLVAILEIIGIIVLASFKIVPAFFVQVVIVITMLALNRQNSSCKGIFKTGVFYLQTMDTLIVSTDIWPDSVYKAQAYFSSAFNLHFSALACLFPELFSLFAKHLFLLLLPIICTCLIWSAYGVWTLIYRIDQHSSRMAKFKCRHYSLLFFDLAYFPVVKATFSVISKCREVDSVSFMKNFPWINCDCNEYYALVIMSWLAVVFYAIGIPFFLYAPLLYRNQGNLIDDSSEVRAWLGSLYLAYKPRFRLYMEVLMTIRRLLIALFFTAVLGSEQLQTALIAVVLLISILFQALARPFVYPTHSKAAESEQGRETNGLENIVEIVMLSVVLLSLISTRLSAAKSTLEYTSSLFVITIIANSLMVILLGLSGIYRLFPRLAGKFHLSDNEQPLLQVVQENDEQGY